MVTKEIPILYNRKEECCGCTACYAICPKVAICMVEDEEGFELMMTNVFVVTNVLKFAL